MNGDVPKLESRGGHSADVRISLMFRGQSIPVAQLGPDFLLRIITWNRVSRGRLDGRVL